MDSFIQIEIPVANEAQMELVVAILTPLGFNGFLEEENMLKAYIIEADFMQDDFLLIMNQQGLTYSLSVLKNQNWNALWESNFEPITVDDFVGVRANFHPPISGVEHELIITPKMSFGTGHHGTTYGVMQLMKGINFTNEWVLDFGTGTGILAILADKLGACNVLALDNDEWSINNAKENCKVNECINIDIVLRDSLDTEWQFDIAIANINRHIIESNLAVLAAVVKPYGILVLSGLLEQDEVDIVKATVEFGFTHDKTVKKDGWVAIQFSKP